MRRYLIATIALFLPLCAYSQMDPYMGEAIMQELKELRREVTELKVEVEVLRKDLAVKKKSSRKGKARKTFNFSGGGGFHNHSSRGADFEALSEVEVPDMTDREAVKAYIAELRRISTGQNSWSSMDPQHEMLQAVGEDNVDLLLNAMTGRQHGGGLDYYVYEVLAKLATDDHKEMIIERLPFNRGLVKTVLALGWTEDAREELLEGLEENQNYLPTEWVKAVASLRDPETYEALSEYLTYGSNKRWTFEAVEYLPDFDLKGAVAQAWEEVSTGREQHDIEDFAPIAVEFGHEDALAVVVDSLNSSSSWDRDRARRALYKVTDFRGSVKKAQAWYDENVDKLTFDENKSKFVVNK